MNCQECRERLAAYLEGLLDVTCQSQIDSHVAECAACQSELRDARELTIRLTCAGSRTHSRLFANGRDGSHCSRASPSD